MDLTLKGNKKTKPIVFERGGQREEGKIKGGKVTVGEGLSADSGIENSVPLSVITLTLYFSSQFEGTRSSSSPPTAKRNHCAQSCW